MQGREGRGGWKGSSGQEEEVEWLSWEHWRTSKQVVIEGKISNKMVGWNNDGSSISFV